MKRLAYWFDIYGPDQRPANGKVLSTLGFWFAWALMFVWVSSAENLGGDFVMALGLVLSIPFGADGFKAAIKAKNEGGVGSKMRDEGKDLRPPVDVVP